MYKTSKLGAKPKKDTYCLQISKVTDPGSIFPAVPSESVGFAYESLEGVAFKVIDARIENGPQLRIFLPFQYIVAWRYHSQVDIR